MDNAVAVSSVTDKVVTEARRNKNKLAAQWSLKKLHSLVHPVNYGCIDSFCWSSI